MTEGKGKLAKGGPRGGMAVPFLVVGLVIGVCAGMFYAVNGGGSLQTTKIDDSALRDGLEGQVAALEKYVSLHTDLSERLTSAMAALQEAAPDGGPGGAQGKPSEESTAENTRKMLQLALHPESNSFMSSLIDSTAARAAEIIAAKQQASPAVADCQCPDGPPARKVWAAGEVKPLCLDGASPGRWTNYSEWEADNCRYRDIQTKELRQCLKARWVHFYGDSLSRLFANDFSRKAGMQRRDWSSDKNRGQLMDTAADAATTTAATTTPGKPEQGDNKAGGGRRRLLGGKEGGGRGRGRGRSAQEAPAIHPSRNRNHPRITYLFRGKMAHQRHPK
eukprot:jgi/Mesen1/1906/ME000143S00965